MQLKPNTPLVEIPVQRVFIGSCTNSRIEDLRAAAAIAKGRKVAEGVRAMVVPGSGLVKHQAEEEGLDRIFLEAGFEWREPGCSNCMSMNADRRRARRAHRLDLEPQFRGPPGHERARPIWWARRWPPPPPSPATSPTCGSCELSVAYRLIATSLETGRVPSAPSALEGTAEHDRSRAAFATGLQDREAASDMEKFTQLTGVAAPMPMINIDTDKIFPAIYLRTIKRTGLSK